MNNKPLNKSFISILIPVHDDLKGLVITLQSLKENGIVDRLDTEIIICNDGGGEIISNLTKQYDCKEAKLEHQSGSYAVRNKGIEIANGDILAFLDADQRVDKSWLDAGLKALEAADYIGGRIKIETSDQPDIWELYDQMKAFPVSEYLKDQYFAPTANLFVRREVFEKVGIFRNELYSGGDYEFGIRIKKAGFVQRYAPDAITYHKARNKREQLKKIQRVAKGSVEVKFVYLRESPLKVALTSFFILIKVPFEMIWRVTKYLFECLDVNSSKCLYIILIGKYRKLFHYYWLLIFSMGWLYKNLHLKTTEFNCHD